MRMPRIAALAIAASLVLSACGSSTPTAPPSTSDIESPAPTTAPTVAPTEPPPDVAALVNSRADSLKSGTMTFEATTTVGAVQTELAGSATFSGIESSTQITVTLAGTPTRVEAVVVGGKSFARSGDGPWLEVASAPAKSVTAQLQEIAAGSLTDAGTVTRDGATVHRLVPGAGASFDPASIMSGARGATVQQADIALFASEAGEPVGASIEASFSVTVGDAQVAGSLSMDMHFASLGVKQTIRPPDDVWTTFASSRYHVSVAYPADYEYEKLKDADMFWSPDFGGAGTARDSASGGTLTQWAKGTLSELKKSFHTKQGSNEPATLAGTKARLLTINGKTDDGDKVVFYYVIAVKGKYVYGIWWMSRAGNEAADLATFRQMLSTFAFA